MAASDTMGGGFRQRLIPAVLGLAVLGSGLGLAPGTAWAALVLEVTDEGVWSFTPRITASQTYTDNVNLSPPGQEDWDLITEISPGFSVTRNTRRLSLDFNYTLRNRGYWRDERDSTSTQLLSASSTAELLRNRVFLDASASRRERALSLLAPVGIGSDVGGGNFTVATNWSFGPRLQQRFGSFANFNSQYTVNGVSYSGRNAPQDSVGQQASAQLSSGSGFSLIDWALQGQWRLEDFQGFDEEVTLSSASATLGINPTRKIRLFGTAGTEWNDFDADFGDREGEFWNASASYAFTRRTSLEASYGERFFGTTRSFAINQRNRRTVFRAQRAQTVTTSRDPQFLQVDEVLVFDGSCDPAAAGCDPVATLPVFQATLFDRVFLVDSTTVSLSLNLPKSTWTLAGTLREQERLSSRVDAGAPDDTAPDAADNSTSRTLQGQVSWRLTPRSDLNLNLGYTENDFTSLDREDRLYSGQLGWNRSFGQRTNGSLTYRHQRRQTSDDSAEFQENAIIAQATMTF